MRKQSLSARTRVAALCLALIALALPWAAARAQAHIPTSSGDNDTFVEATVNNVNPSQGDQLTYVFRYYQAVDALQLPGMLVGQPDYEAPEFSNFWAEGEIEQSSTQTQLNGRTYNVSELRTHIFPTTAGTITIEPARLILHGFPGEPDRVLETLPVTIAARALPAGAPASFNGAIGDYRLTANVDRTTATPTEPITLQLRLAGEGNVRMAPSPVLPDLPGWRVQERSNEVQIDVIDGRVQGTRTIDLLLLPSDDATSLTLPPIEYAFFNPATSTYLSALSNPIEITLLDGAGAPVAAVAPSAKALVDPAAAAGAVQAAPAAAAEAQSVADAAPVATPAYTIMAAPATLPIAARLVESPWFWALWLLPLFALIAGWLGLRTARTAAARQSERKRTHAASDALHDLRSAPDSAAAQKVLDDYLARALGRPVRGLTRTGRAALLTEKGVPEALQARVEECYTMGERARYSPTENVAATAAPERDQRMHSAVETVIRELDPLLRMPDSNRVAAVPTTVGAQSATANAGRAQ
jgi:hypothetical protein